MLEGLEYLCCKEKLREQGLSSLEKRRCMENIMNAYE